MNPANVPTTPRDDFWLNVFAVVCSIAVIASCGMLSTYSEARADCKRAKEMRWKGPEMEAQYERYCHPNGNPRRSSGTLT